MSGSPYMNLLENFCKDEKVSPPVYTLLNNSDNSDLVQVEVYAANYKKIGDGKIESEARESAAHHIYELLLSIPSIHFNSGVSAEPGSGSASREIKFNLRSLEDKPWRKRQVQQLHNKLEFAANQRGLFHIFKEVERIKAMDALNKNSPAESRIKKAAIALGTKIIWGKPRKQTNPPVVAVLLAETNPKLTFFGLDREDAASNCASYLKTILLEDSKDYISSIAK